MSRRNITLSPRYDKMLVALSKKLEISMTETMQRAIELLDEEEARKDRLRAMDSVKTPEEFCEWLRKEQLLMKAERGGK